MHTLSPNAQLGYLNMACLPGETYIEQALGNQTPKWVHVTVMEVTWQAGQLQGMHATDRGSLQCLP